MEDGSTTGRLSERGRDMAIESDRQPVILIVDDAPENLAVLSGVLQGPYRLKVATSGASALRICDAAVLPDLILLDVMMPEMDGLEVCRRLKANPRTAPIPVIFVTALADSHDEARGLEVGAVDYITKPISPPVVRQRVRVHLDLKFAREELERLGRQYRSYLSTELAHGIQRGEVPSGVISRKRNLTVLFSDIVGFTAQSERCVPAAMTHALNAYFDRMAALVEAHKGTLDKFIGDACMVFFGDPLTRGPEADAIACVRLAQDMLASLPTLQSDWQKVTGEPLQVRIGIASGPCIVGNVGSTRQMQYTALGPTVNLASRLEARSQPGQVLIAHATYELVQHAFACIQQPDIFVKGIDRPIRTYVVGPPR